MAKVRPIPPVEVDNHIDQNGPTFEANISLNSKREYSKNYLLILSVRNLSEAFYDKHHFLIVFLLRRHSNLITEKAFSN